MGAIEDAKRKVREQIAAREGRTSVDDRAADYQRREQVPATPNQIRRDDRQREFDAERNRPTAQEQSDARDATRAKMKEDRHKQFDDDRKEMERKRKADQQIERDAEEVRQQQKHEGGTSAKEFRDMRKRNEDKEFRNQHVEPMLPFHEAVKRKAVKVKQEVVHRTKDAFISEIMRPAKAVQAGRKQRAQQQVQPIDPFGQLLAPQPRRESRRTRDQVPMGTGLLFSEGLFNPPKQAGRKTKKARSATGRRSSSDPWDMLL